MVNRFSESSDDDEGEEQSFFDMLRASTSGAKLVSLQIEYSNGVVLSIQFPDPEEDA